MLWVLLLQIMVETQRAELEEKLMMAKIAKLEKELAEAEEEAEAAELEEAQLLEADASLALALEERQLEVNKIKAENAALVIANTQLAEKKTELTEQLRKIVEDISEVKKGGAEIMHMQETPETVAQKKVKLAARLDC